MKIFMALPFSFLVILVYCKADIVRNPGSIFGENYPFSKAIAPLPAQEKNSDIEHGSNADDTQDTLFMNVTRCSSNYGYAYDIVHRRCAQINSTAHCGRFMMFYNFLDSRYLGSCDCERYSRVPLFQISKPNAARRCYYIYTQAHCADGFWLEPDYQGKPRCFTNKCYKYGSSFGQPALASRDQRPIYVPFNTHGNCTRLFHSSIYCNNNEVVKFVGSNKYASCSM